MGPELDPHQDKTKGTKTDTLPKVAQQDTTKKQAADTSRQGTGPVFPRRDSTTVQPSGAAPGTVASLFVPATTVRLENYPTPAGQTLDGLKDPKVSQMVKFTAQEIEWGNKAAAAIHRQEGTVELDHPRKAAAVLLALRWEKIYNDNKPKGTAPFDGAPSRDLRDDRFKFFPASVRKQGVTDPQLYSALGGLGSEDAARLYATMGTVVTPKVMWGASSDPRNIKTVRSTQEMQEIFTAQIGAGEKGFSATAKLTNLELKVKEDIVAMASKPAEFTATLRGALADSYKKITSVRDEIAPTLFRVSVPPGTLPTVPR